MLQNILIFQLIQNPISRYCNYYIIQYPYISIFLRDASERCPPGPSLGRRTWVANAGHHYSIIPFSSSLSVKIETLSKPSPDRSSRQYKLSAYHTWNCRTRTHDPWAGNQASSLSALFNYSIFIIIYKLFAKNLRHCKHSYFLSFHPVPITNLRHV